MPLKRHAEYLGQHVVIEIERDALALCFSVRGDPFRWQWTRISGLGWLPPPLRLAALGFCFCFCFSSSRVPLLSRTAAACSSTSLKAN